MEFRLRVYPNAPDGEGVMVLGEKKPAKAGDVSATGTRVARPVAGRG